MTGSMDRLLDVCGTNSPSFDVWTQLDRDYERRVDEREGGGGREYRATQNKCPVSAALKAIEYGCRGDKGAGVGVVEWRCEPASFSVSDYSSRLQISGEEHAGLAVFP